MNKNSLYLIILAIFLQSKMHSAEQGQPYRVQLCQQLRQLSAADRIGHPELFENGSRLLQQYLHDYSSFDRLAQVVSDCGMQTDNGSSILETLLNRETDATRRNALAVQIQPYLKKKLTTFVSSRQNELRNYLYESSKDTLVKIVKPLLDSEPIERYASAVKEYTTDTLLNYAATESLLKKLQELESNPIKNRLLKIEYLKNELSRKVSYKYLHELISLIAETGVPYDQALWNKIKEYGDDRFEPILQGLYQLEKDPIRKKSVERVLLQRQLSLYPSAETFQKLVNFLINNEGWSYENATRNAVQFVPTATDLNFKGITFMGDIFNQEQDTTNKVAFVKAFSSKDFRTPMPDSIFKFRYQHPELFK